MLQLVVKLQEDEDEADLVDYASSYKLNRSFEYVTAGQEANMMHSAQIYPAGPCIAISVPSLAMLIQSFNFFTVNDLLMLCTAHDVMFASSSKSISKPRLLKIMIDHHCSHKCRDIKYVFKLKLTERRSARHVKLNVVTESLEATLTSHRLQKAKAKQAERGRMPDMQYEQVLKTNREGHKNSYDQSKKQDDHEFPTVVNDAFKHQIISEWQREMDPDCWTMSGCAVCAHRTPKKEMQVVLPEDIEFGLLQNPHLPDETRPTTYNLEAYQGAILYVDGLQCKDDLGPINMCRSCKNTLVEKKEQPKDSLANWHYTGFDELPTEVRKAFESASMFDIMMVARCRATRITQLYAKKKGSTNYRQDPTESQRYDRGNVSIIPQDVASVRPLLPPDSGEIQTAMAVLFSGGKEKPTAENMSKLSPVLVSKNRVQTMLDFLLTKNMWYQTSGVAFSPENFNNMFSDEDEGTDEAVPHAVDICWLPEEKAKDVEGANADYTDRNEYTCSGDNEDVVMEAVGYAAGDRTPQNYNIMKASALAWCLSRKKFIKMQGGSQLLSDRDPGMLTYLFPHLDPWGIAGFYQSNRTAQQHISFGRQVKNLIMHNKSPFQADPNFAYVCWNILQKREVNKTASFRTKVDYQKTIVTELNEIGPVIPELIAKWEKNPKAKASNKQEKRAIRLLDRLKLVAKDLKGSSGYKLCRRNEIRALMKKYSTPALFVTINPADLYHPLLGVIAGKTADEWRSMDLHARAVFVARHPGPAAQFFDVMMKSFIDIILRHGKEGGGLFGKSQTYYGMVEAQGRGTLHCHMLIWIKGNPGPQELRDRMTNEDGFKLKMFDWIESIIKCDLPDMTEILEENAGALPRPKLPKGDMDPRMRPQPEFSDITEDQFANDFRMFVKELAIRCNWHEHKSICWKHLKPGEKRGDPVCRMRIDGKTRTFTDLDEETQSILIKRLHPRINNFNDVVIFLMQCNMDIKYVGSGEAAKALVYYVTDYITKENLATEVGLGALAYAIHQNEIKFQGDNETPLSLKGKSLFIKTVNSMMARQELSHQQVLSYFIGGGDHYKTNTFRIVKWAEIDHYVRIDLQEKQWSGQEGESMDGEVDEEEIGDIHEDPCTNLPTKDHEGFDCDDLDDSADDMQSVGAEEMTLRVENETIVPANHLLDYTMRSQDDDFNKLSLWEHAEWVCKITKKAETLRKIKERPTKSRVSHRSNQDQNSKHRPGRKATARGDFCSRQHPNYKTHTNRLREIPFVPVMLGNAFPRGDRGPKEREQWCRAMMILFKPWRSPTDLKNNQDSWTQAFGATEFSFGVTQIIKNMNIENECRDARDNYSQQRHNKANPPLGFVMADIQTADMDSLDTAATNDFRLDRSDGHDEAWDDGYENAEIATSSNGRADELVGLLNQTGLFECQKEHKIDKPYGSASTVTEHEKTVMAMQKTLMDEMKKDKRPAVDTESSKESKHQSKRRKESFPSVTLTELEDTAEFVNVVSRSEAPFTPHQALEDIIDEFQIRDNLEQQRAIRIIAEHFISNTEEQMLCHISGPGGTGKSYVVKAIVEFFKRCGASDELMLSASTGCAAVLIHGYTLHALTFLGPRKTYTRPEMLERLWKNVRYLVVDEVSMISAHFLDQVSERISKAKAWNPTSLDKPFGGVNLIFTGDIGQLPPVNAASLFSHTLVNQINSNVAQTPTGQGALNGAFLWRQVNKVIILKKNERAKKDPRFINLLSRVREGRAWDGHKKKDTMQEGSGDNYTSSDYETLLGRRLHLLAKKDKTVLNKFKDAKIVVGEKVLRDVINNKIVHGFAEKTQQELHWYHADDRYRNAPLKGTLRNRMLRAQSNVTNDAIGMLPLVPGMRLMITDNVAMRGGVANGCEGILQDIKYEINEHGERKAICAYVKVPGANVQAPGLPPDVIPILPEKTTFKYAVPDGASYFISRSQLPVVPAYAYTANKIQGQSLEHALVDLKSARGTQALYVMISRAVSLENLAVIRWFPSTNLDRRLSQAYRNEFERIRLLDEKTTSEFRRRRWRPVTHQPPKQFYTPSTAL